MKESCESPREGPPPEPVRPVRVDAATKPVVPPPRGLIFLIAVLKKRHESESSEHER